MLNRHWNVDRMRKYTWVVEKIVDKNFCTSLVFVNDMPLPTIAPKCFVARRLVECDDSFLHERFWLAIKAAGDAKKTMDPKAGEDLLDKIDEIADIFWATKGGKPDWMTS
jgi:hypothetical protein